MKVTTFANSQRLCHRKGYSNDMHKTKATRKASDVGILNQKKRKGQFPSYLPENFSNNVTQRSHAPECDKPTADFSVHPPIIPGYYNK